MSCYFVARALAVAIAAAIRVESPPFRGALGRSCCSAAFRFLCSFGVVA